jgi:hypothetical protein
MNDCEVCKFPILSKKYICDDCRKAFIDWCHDNVSSEDDIYDNLKQSWFSAIEWYIKNIKDE